MITEEKSIFQMLVSIANGESPHNILLETTGEKYKKDEAETIFKFAMNAKGTDLQNWKIE
jgi:hypothetical protein